MDDLSLVRNLEPCRSRSVEVWLMMLIINVQCATELTSGLLSVAGCLDFGLHCSDIQLAHVKLNLVECVLSSVVTEYIKWLKRNALNDSCFILFQRL